MEKVHLIIILLAVICLSKGAKKKTSFLEDVCQEPKDAGEPCEDGSEPRKAYFFDDYEEYCKSFEFKGCKGNKNRFNTSDECIDSCQMAWLLKKNKEEPDPDVNIQKLRTKSDCLLTQAQGECKALITMWYYSSDNNTCLLFAYGGCNGNFNRFDTEKECRDFCMDASTSTESTMNGTRR